MENRARCFMFSLFIFWIYWYTSAVLGSSHLFSEVEMAQKNYKVRAAHCSWRAPEEEIYQTLRRITDPLHRSWAKLEKADRIVIKFNMMKPHSRIIYYMGRRARVGRRHGRARCVAVVARANPR